VGQHGDTRQRLEGHDAKGGEHRVVDDGPAEQGPEQGHPGEQHHGASRDPARGKPGQRGGKDRSARQGNDVAPLYLGPSQIVFQTATIGGGGLAIVTTSASGAPTGVARVTGTAKNDATPG